MPWPSQHEFRCANKLNNTRERCQNTCLRRSGMDYRTALSLYSCQTGNCHRYPSRQGSTYSRNRCSRTDRSDSTPRHKAGPRTCTLRKYTSLAMCKGFPVVRRSFLTDPDRWDNYCHRSSCQHIADYRYNLCSQVDHILLRK